jgi:5'-3' exonuclease
MSVPGVTKKLVFKKRPSSETNEGNKKGLIKLSKKIVEKPEEPTQESTVVEDEKKVIRKPTSKSTASRAAGSGSRAAGSGSRAAGSGSGSGSGSGTGSGVLSPLIFIDTSYFIFYRYHATKAWYLHSKKDEDAGDLTIDNLGFVENYNKHFRQWTAKISKKFKVPESQFFWFKDSPKEDVWRTPIFPKYKATRDEKCPEGIKGFFLHTYQNLIPLERQMLVPCAEGDDIAAVAAKLENATNPTQPILIITADTDYLQLVNSVTRVVKLPNFDDIPVVVKIGKDKVTVTPDEYLMIKVLLGDTCDEIPKVYSGCGPSTAMNISRNPDEFTRLIENHPDRLEKYQQNLTLISFNEIPDNIRDNCQAAYMAVRSL